MYKGAKGRKRAQAERRQGVGERKIRGGPGALNTRYLYGHHMIHLIIFRPSRQDKLLAVMRDGLVAGLERIMTT